MESVPAESCCSSAGTTLIAEMQQQPDVVESTPSTEDMACIHEHIIDLQVRIMSPSCSPSIVDHHVDPPSTPSPQAHKRRLSACAAREQFRNGVLLAYMRHLAALLCTVKEENHELRLHLQLLSQAAGDA